MSPQDKTLLSIATLLCFLFAGQRLYKFQYDHIPLAYPTDCIEISIPPDIKEQYKVESIDIESGSTILSYSYYKTKVSFSELKDLNAKKVDCNE